MNGFNGKLNNNFLKSYVVCKWVACWMIKKYSKELDEFVNKVPFMACQMERIYGTCDVWKIYDGNLENFYIHRRGKILSESNDGHCHITHRTTYF